MATEKDLTDDALERAGVMTYEVREAFLRLFAIADKDGDYAIAARSLLGAWWSASTLGPLYPRNLWALDVNNMKAAKVAMLWFMGRNSLEGTEFEEPMRALARRMAADRARATAQE